MHSYIISVLNSQYLIHTFENNKIQHNIIHKLQTLQQYNKYINNNEPYFIIS